MQRSLLSDRTHTDHVIETARTREWRLSCLCLLLDWGSQNHVAVHRVWWNYQELSPRFETQRGPPQSMLEPSRSVSAVRDATHPCAITPPHPHDLVTSSNFEKASRLCIKSTSWSSTELHHQQRQRPSTCKHCEQRANAFHAISPKLQSAPSQLRPHTSTPHHQPCLSFHAASRSSLPSSASWMTTPT